MAQQPIEDLLAKADGSVYKLVRLAAKRALELSEGQPPLIKNPSTDKVTTLALEEIAQGKVVYKNGSSDKKGAKKAQIEEPSEEAKTEEA